MRSNNTNTHHSFTNIDCFMGAHNCTGSVVINNNSCRITAADQQRFVQDQSDVKWVMLRSIKHHSRGRLQNYDGYHLARLQPRTYPEYKIIFNFGLHRGVVYVERRQCLEWGAAGHRRAEASSGLRRRERNLDPLLGFCGVQNRSPRTLRVHGVLQLEHDAQSFLTRFFTANDANLMKHPG